MSGKVKKKKSIFKAIVGTAVVVLLAAYFVFALFSYFNKRRINYYEVEEGSLVKEHNFTGLILRTEKVVESEESGYISFFVPDKRKVAKGQSVYLIDGTGRLAEFFQKETESLNALDKSKLQMIKESVKAASVGFDPVSFRDSYDIRESLDGIIQEYTSIDSLNAMSEDLKKSGIVFHEFPAQKTGTVSYSIDGYEEITTEDITQSLFDRSQYQRTRVLSGELVEQGQPVYKLITDEKWYLVFEENEEIKNQLSGKDTIKVSLGDKSITFNVPYTSIMSVDGNVYGLLTLDRYMVQFVSDRFLDFEIVTNDVSGLKIPEKAITSKEFYVIPEEFKKTDDMGNEGFYKMTVSENGTSAKFIVCDVYVTENGLCYTDLNGKPELTEGDLVSVSPDGSGESFRIGEKKAVEGVYNVNKGYAVFKRIERLESSNGYCIVKKNSSYGLTVYDHIVLDSSQVQEGQVIY